MPNVIDIQQFLVGKTFYIPLYQRDYSWTTIQVGDLIDDVDESIATSSGHYLGTVVLAQNTAQAYEIVDGQQRLTTLTLIIHALLEELLQDDPDRIANEAILLRHGQTLKLDFGCNASFVDNLFSANNPTPTSAGQRKLKEAYRFARDRAHALARRGDVKLIKDWLNIIRKLEIIQFVANNTGRAIRMFQTVNDRGLPLTAMDKAKALLVFYSNRYLSGTLDQTINSSFGDCFSVFDALREFVSAPGYRIDNIDRDTFSEDDILRYHYLAYSHPDASNAADYDGSIRTVFEGFLKGTLKDLSGNPSKLRSFIDDYISDLSAFAAAFKGLVAAIKTDARLYKLFVILGLAARLYPLTIRLYQRNLLFASVPNTQLEILDCIEVCDVRVYKTRGTDPAKDIGDLSHSSRVVSVKDVADGLKSFTIRFMPDGTFQTNLGQNMYHNAALSLLLLSYDEQVAGPLYSYSDLVQRVTNQITREHIVAQTPNWSVTSHGFVDDIDYQNHLHMLGNLTLLSKTENSRCSNQPVHTKITDRNMYAASMYAGTRQLAHQYASGGGAFNKTDILGRTQTLTNFIMSKWAIW